ncbi:hypothetical protein Gotri_011243 [Gossypium trilobum]|uniref:Uncharacterized protein n=1 Tax=Gossypium trilobum TaxID=34281 RepID=A0A7J9ET67_9ROSI|nr:hypothetical protein [Gossypium trilobum]
MNPFSHRTRRLVWSTCPGSELLASHICYWWMRGVGKFVRRGQDERPNSVCLDEVSRQVRHRLRPNKRHQCLLHSPPSCVYIFWGISVPSILCPHVDVDAIANVESNANVCTIIDGETGVNIDSNIDA